jgi:predicted transposase YbfD/YdcC
MASSKSLIEHFSVIKDPRINRKKRHRLIDIIVISICGVICGCDSFVDIEEYGLSKQDWFRSRLELKHGIPSHDTIGRVFSLINPLQFQKAFYEWAQGLVILKEEYISIDGKYISSSHGATNNSRSIFGMVNAWASKAGVALAQLRTDYEKTDEKQAFRDIIDFLDLEGAIVTMDANGAVADITNRIIDKGGDFIVGLKKNQKSLYENAQRLMESTDKVDISIFESKEMSHGRLETRRCESVNWSENFLNELKEKNHKRDQKVWKNLQSVCRITSERTIKGVTTKQERYYLSSLEANAQKQLEVIRSHWGIENKLHWTLDVCFNEDSCRVRKGHGGENLAVIRQLALNLLKQEKSDKKSMKTKRLSCGWDNEYLEKIISGMNSSNIVV